MNMKEIKILGDRASGRSSIALYVLNSEPNSVLVSSYRIDNYKMLSEELFVGIDIIDHKNFVHCGLSKIDQLVDKLEGRKFKIIIIDDSHNYNLTKEDREVLSSFCTQLIEII